APRLSHNANDREEAPMEEWLDGFARALGERSPGREEVGAVLALAREVAHGVERRLAPRPSFIAGLHVQRRVAEGAAVSEARAESRAAASEVAPEPPTA